MLNNEQLQAVNSNSNRILCLAGAGAGKSYCMLSRMNRLISEGISSYNILAITFSRAGALHMEEAFKKSYPNIPCPTFRTFHGFCYMLLVSDTNIRQKLGYNALSAPDIIEEEAEKQYRIQAKILAGVKKLSDKKLSATDTSTLTLKEKFEYNLYHKVLNNLLASKNVITYDLLCDSICKLFVDDEDCIQKYKRRFTHIFVDEFQDTDLTQWQFVSAFVDSNIYVTGDALQNLYAFRGTDNSIIKGLATNTDWTTIKLTTNYRSTPNICKFANAQSKSYADDEYRIEMQSPQPNVGDEVRVTKVEKYDTFNLAEDIKTSCLDILNNIQSDETTAILCRTNKEVDMVCKALKESDVSFTTTHKSVFNQNILLAVNDDEFKTNFLLSFLTTKEYMQYIKQSLLKERSEQLHDYQVAHPQMALTTSLISQIDELLQASQIYNAKTCESILKLLLPDSDIEVSDDIETDSKEKLIDYLIIKLSVSANTSNTYVGTIHSVKGLEYDNVILLGINSPMFRLNNEDNNNLYYVGITRAKKHLYIYQSL